MITDAVSTARRPGSSKPRRHARTVRRLFAIGTTGWILAACDGPPDRTPTVGDADPRRGLRLVVEKGCAACHAFPDVGWPRGGLGPSLEGFNRQGLIAGRLPNQPGVLMQFVRDAPRLVPGTAMPAAPMSDQDARDVVAYLLALKSR